MGITLKEFKKLLDDCGFDENLPLKFESELYGYDIRFNMIHNDHDRNKGFNVVVSLKVEEV